MNLKQIEAVLEINKTKNFTTAAENLFISQPTLSTHIKQLEEELEIELFKRHKKRKVELTSAGEKFIIYAERIQSNLDKLSWAMKKIDTNTSGELRIGLLWTFGYTRIRETIREFRNKYPNIKLLFKIDASEVLIQDLLRYQLDSIFITEANKNSLFGLNEEFNHYLISQSNLTLVMNKNHPLATKKYIEFEDLEGESILNVSKRSSMYPEITPQLKKEHAAIIGESSQADIIFQIAEEAIGMGFLAEETCKYFNNPNVVSIPLFPPIKRNIYYVCNPESENSKWSKLFKDFLLSKNSTT
ncbi:LysR family transcriptional regulator [uncultured Veillonella sp.]|uniref:LysR family transcriptional regulator n=1 Tax=uncultured Veillonella sp. TaxID=159268 RepID=UPI00260B20DE|nr:LysR family transcriptional regulator [uncultured Veillonella sp.]